MTTHSNLIRLTASILPFAMGCTVASVDVIPRYGQAELEGHFGITTTPGIPIPDADLQTAGFEEDEGYFGLAIALDLGAPVLTISTQSTTHEGSGVLDSTLTGGGGTIPADTPVDSAMDLGIHQFTFTWDLIPTDYVDIGLGLGVAVVDIDAQMSGAGETISSDQVLPVPVLALRARVDLGPFEATGTLSGMDFSVDGDSASFLDLDLIAQLHIFGGDERLAGSIGIGYRKTNMSVEYEDGADRIDADMRLNGPYLAFVFGF